MFEFERGEGRDTITDFTNGTDRLDLDDFSRAQVQPAIGNARQSGGDVILALSADTSVTIKNLQLSQFDIGDFIF